MVKKGDSIDNPVSGERIVFTETSEDTGGKYLRFDYYLNPGGYTEPYHFHPHVEQRFKVIKGKFVIKIDGKSITPKPGDSIIIPAGIPHRGWNAGTEEVLLDHEMHPPMEFENWFEVCFKLAKQGKVNKRGLPKFLRLTVLSYEMKNLSFFPRLVWAQKLFINIVGFTAGLFGYKSGYEKK